MEEIEAPKPIAVTIRPRKLSQSIDFDVSINKDQYKLKIETYTDETIEFSLRQTNMITFLNYKNEFNYDEIITKLMLVKDYYPDMNKVLKFIEMAITKKKLSIKEEKEKKILNIKKVIDFDEVECEIILEEKEIKKEEMIMIMFEEIKELKKKIEIINVENLKNKEKSTKSNDEEIIKKIQEKIQHIEEDKIKKIEESININEKELTKKIEEIISITIKEKLNKIDEKLQSIEKEKIKAIQDKIKMTEDELRKNMEERIKEIENDKLRQINEKMKILEEDKLKSVDKINNLSKEISRIKQENLDIKVIPLQLCNGWRNLEREFGYGKIIKKGNEITLSGVLTGQMYKPICILPEDCRPKKQLIFTLNHQDGILRFDVYPNGTVAYCAGTPKYEWVSLEGIHYFVGI